MLLIVVFRAFRSLFNKLIVNSIIYLRIVVYFVLPVKVFYSGSEFNYFLWVENFLIET